MREFDYENPFNSENLWMDYDPMYAMTADYIDQFGTVEYQQTADLESYVDALWLATYQRILINGIKKGTVPHPTGAAVTDCFLQRLEPSIKEDAAPGIFNLNAIFLVKTSDRFQQQYRVCGCIDLVGNHTDIAQEILFYDENDKRRGRPLSQSLIPIIPKKELDAEASRILKKYRMKKTDARKLAEKMGYMVREAQLSKKHRICGELYLHDAMVKVYREDGTEERMEVKAGTILYDPDACGSDDKIEETILHECIHGEVHFLFYRLQKLYYEGLDLLNFINPGYVEEQPEDIYEHRLEEESESPDKEKTDIQWMEWQAQELTDRIRMPAEHTLKSIDQLVSRYQEDNLTETYEKIIPKLARKYRVTEEAAKKRMLELGCTDAVGAGNVVDGREIPAYTMSEGNGLASNTSYEISVEDVKKLYASDPVFSALVGRGAFVYAEGHYCLDDPVYIRRDDIGIPHLTKKARKDIDQCCLLFRYSYDGPRNFYDKDAFHSDNLNSDPIAVALASIPIEELNRLKINDAFLTGALPDTFGKTLKYHRKKAGLSQEELAELCGTSNDTISRYERLQHPSTSKQMIARIGVELKLRGDYIEDLLYKANQRLDPSDEKDRVLRIAIYYVSPKGVEACNQFLIENNCKTLGSRKKAFEN